MKNERRTWAVYLDALNEKQNFSERWLNDIYDKISETYYSGEQLNPDTLNRYRGIIEAAHKLGFLDVYESDLLEFQLSKIKQRNN